MNSSGNSGKAAVDVASRATKLREQINRLVASIGHSDGYRDREHKIREGESDLARQRGLLVSTRNPHKRDRIQLHIDRLELQIDSLKAANRAEDEHREMVSAAYVRPLKALQTLEGK